MRRVEAAVACTGHLGADHPREQDAVARMGEDDVVGKTVIERELLLAHLVGGDGDRPCNLPAVAGVLQMVGELDAHRIRERHDQYPFVRPGALALSVSCWRQRATVPVRLLRFSLKVREHLLRVILRRIARIALVLVGAGADVLGLLLGQADDLLLAGDGERLLLRVGHDGVSLSGRRGEQLVALAQDAPRLLPLLRIAHADLVQDVEEHLGLDNLELRVLAKRGLSVLDDALELVDKALDALARKGFARHPVSFHWVRIKL